MITRWLSAWAVRSKKLASVKSHFSLLGSQFTPVVTTSRPIQCTLTLCFLRAAFLCSSRCSVSEEHLMGPSMCMCICVCLASFVRFVETCCCNSKKRGYLGGFYCKSVILDDWCNNDLWYHCCLRYHYCICYFLGCPMRHLPWFVLKEVHLSSRLISSCHLL